MSELLVQAIESEWCIVNRTHIDDARLGGSESRELAPPSDWYWTGKKWSTLKSAKRFATEQAAVDYVARHRAALEASAGSN